MISYLFQLLKGSTLRQAKSELIKLGLSNLYSIKDSQTKEVFIGGTSEHPFHSNLKHSLLVEENASGQIDWDQQWASFAENFHDGKADIDLSKYGKKASLLLFPGPGFGDLSHPTTRLMLELMKGQIAGKNVIDIGCGSGILTLAALKLGATSAIGVDIDLNALTHARKNALLNNLNAIFLESAEIKSNRETKLQKENTLLLMNMILPEQCEVMKQSSSFNPLGTRWIVSGILSTQKAKYLALTEKWGWILRKQLQQDQWLAMVFDVGEEVLHA